MLKWGTGPLCEDRPSPTFPRGEPSFFGTEISIKETEQ